ncbi:MAG: radical SAM/SPASM domain-containing protein [Candidatus Cloacimonadaceae bacterium]|nr:radical SAM/SPASM domain-containing protein [Candidatus Cloacimonadaceae bacterium]MDP3113285.1 radical SAM/SPASM domain-containing protein [Candidatus Cloacimonadaceae bacterium]
MNVPMITDVLKTYLMRRRLPNAAGSYLSYHLSITTKRVWHGFYPPAIMIEPTNICNLRCPLCPSGNGGMERARGMMTIQRYKKIIREIRSHIGTLILWNQGEPFLHPDIYTMFDFAVKEGMYVLTSTNFSLEIDHIKLIDSGLQHLIISMDGISNTTYDQYRVNGDYDLVLHNMKELIRIKKLRHSRHPYIIWQFIVMKHNEHEIPAVKQMARRLGVDKLEIKTAQIYAQDDMQVFIPSDAKYSRYHKSEGEFRIKAELLNRCRRLWTQPVVNWDGEVAVCCYDKDVSFPIGNVDDEGFYRLWCSTAFNDLRRDILHRRKDFEICRNCGEGIRLKVKN